MATRNPTTTTLPTLVDYNRVTIVTWTGLLNSDDGAPIEQPSFADRTVAFTGTFGVGGTVQVEGSIDGTNYFVLTDPQGNNISKTAAGLESVSEAVRYIRPKVTAGDGTTSLTCTMLLRG